MWVASRAPRGYPEALGAVWVASRAPRAASSASRASGGYPEVLGPRRPLREHPEATPVPRGVGGRVGRYEIPRVFVGRVGRFESTPRLPEATPRFRRRVDPVTRGLGAVWVASKAHRGYPESMGAVWVASKAHRGYPEVLGPCRPLREHPEATPRLPEIWAPRRPLREHTEATLRLPEVWGAVWVASRAHRAQYAPAW